MRLRVFLTDLRSIPSEIPSVALRPSGAGRHLPGDRFMQTDPRQVVFLYLAESRIIFSFESASLQPVWLWRRSLPMSWH